MQDVARQQRLSELQARIATIEKRPLLAEATALSNTPAGDTPAMLQVPGGISHEIFTNEQRNSGAALGFALGLARPLLTPARPALLFLQLVHEAQDVGLPYGAGLLPYGIHPDQLILARLSTLPDLLWAMEEALACRAVAAVIAEVLGEPKALDFTVSRRLSLRAASSGASVFTLRYTHHREASASRLRWRIDPAPSAPPRFDDEAPGPPRWQVTLEKGRFGPGMTEAGRELLVDWTEHGFQPAGEKGRGGSGSQFVEPALPSAPLAALGHRLSQAS